MHFSLLAQAEAVAGNGGGLSAQAQWWMTAAVVAVVLIAMFGYALFSRAGIIARAARKEAVRQPVFALLIAVAIAILAINTWLPFFSLGEDVKMLKDCGLATVLISGLLMAVWTSSTSIANEIEGKTAMTLLSKPINRRQFVVGKYVGIMQAVTLMLIPIGIAFLFFIYYKVGYDAREGGGGEIPPWFAMSDLGFLPFSVPALTGIRLEEVLQILPGLLLIFMEIAILTAVSVAISTRAPMVVNMVTCFAIFVVGHLTPVLVQTVFQGLEFVKFTAQMIATVLPSLEIFNTQTAVATGTVIPPIYLGMSALYGAAYCLAAILLAFILFEDRDLA